MPPLLVSAAILIEDERVLLSQRKQGTHLAFCWEFPGGKVEEGEDPRDALARELREELGIACAIGAPVEITFHRYPSKEVLLLFFEATRLSHSAAPRAIDVAAVRWASIEELNDADFPPADLAVLERVRGLLGGAAKGNR